VPVVGDLGKRGNRFHGLLQNSELQPQIDARRRSGLNDDDLPESAESFCLGLNLVALCS
jgi:hypothetical protein